MINRRRQWREQEREKFVGNVFEAQMHLRIRRQSLKTAEIRHAQDVEAVCATLDLCRARFIKNRHRQAKGTIQWVPQSIEKGMKSPLSSKERTQVAPAERVDAFDPGNDPILKVRQPLTENAHYRLNHLGGLDMSRAVPAFVYRNTLVSVHQYSEVATEKSAGIYRVPRLLHNSRVNLAPRPAHCYM